MDFDSDSSGGEPLASEAVAQRVQAQQAAARLRAAAASTLDMDFGRGDDEDDDDHQEGFTRGAEAVAPNPEPRSRSNGQRLRDLIEGQSSMTTNRVSFALLLGMGSDDSLATSIGSPKDLLHPEGSLYAGFCALQRSLAADGLQDTALAFGRLLASRGLIKGQRDVEKQIRSILAEVGQADNWRNQELLALVRRRIFRLFSFSGKQIERFASGLLLMIANPQEYGAVISPVLVDVVGAVVGDVLQLVTFEDGRVVPGARLAAVQKTCPHFGLQHALLSFIYGYLLNKCEGGVGKVEETSEDAYGPPFCVTRIGPSVELDEDVACQECFFGNVAKWFLYLGAYTSAGCDDELRDFVGFLTRVELAVSVRTSVAISRLMVWSAAAAADEAVDTMVLGGESDGDADLLDADALLDADLEVVADDGGAPRARVDMRRRAVVRDVVSTRFALRLFAPHAAASRAALDDDEDQAAPPTARGALDDDDEEEDDDAGYAQYSYDALERQAKTLGKYRGEALQCLAWGRCRFQTLAVYDRLRTPPPGGRCFFAFRSSKVPGTPTGLIEVTDWKATHTYAHAYQCLDELRDSEMWRLFCVAEYLSDHCLGLVPEDGGLLALEPEPHELDSLYMDYLAMLGMSALTPISLMRGMNFAAFYTDRYGRLCLCSMRDAALWDFGDVSVDGCEKVSVELGMDVRRLGEICSVADIPWAVKPLDVAEVRATLGVQDLVRHADCPCLPGAVPVADWLESSTDDSVLLEWACSGGHVNEVSGEFLRSRAENSRVRSYVTCLSCHRMHRNHRPDDGGACYFHRVFVRPKAESGGADGAGDSSQNMDVGD